jgi:hypothetical protein
MAVTVRRQRQARTLGVPCTQETCPVVPPLVAKAGSELSCHDTIAPAPGAKVRCIERKRTFRGFGNIHLCLLQFGGLSTKSAHSLQSHVQSASTPRHDCSALDWGRLCRVGPLSCRMERQIHCGPEAEPDPSKNDHPNPKIRRPASGDAQSRIAGIR